MGQGQVMKGQVEELVSFKGKRVSFLPMTPAAAQGYLQRPAPWSQPSPLALVLPDPFVS